MGRNQWVSCWWQLNLKALFYGWGSTVSRLQSHFEETVYFLHSVPRILWYSFNRPGKDKRPSLPWSHRVVFNMGSLAWESSTLTIRRLLQNTTMSPTLAECWPYPELFFFKHSPGDWLMEHTPIWLLLSFQWNLWKERMLNFWNVLNLINLFLLREIE